MPAPQLLKDPGPSSKELDLRDQPPINVILSNSAKRALPTPPAGFTLRHLRSVNLKNRPVVPFITAVLAEDVETPLHRANSRRLAPIPRRLSQFPIRHKQLTVREQDE